MLKIGDNIYRNLEEQVQKNKEDIAKHYEIDRALANLGIEVVGQVSVKEDLPDPLTYPGDYGDTYAVGSRQEVESGIGTYTYYVFTRPDPNAGEPNNHWLNVGRISIVGPEGPQGPQGEKGETGDAARWYVFNSYRELQITPTSPNYIDGDMAIYLGTETYPKGTIFRLKKFENGSKQWVSYSNIVGPQGIQGPMGLQGPQGIQGPQGEKGPTGDVGGFINIWGILANTEQLPTPQSLNNLTVAYLVEHTGGTDQANDHYDLYIQVGNSSAEAIWENVGPFNAATLVTSGGAGLNVWDADSKLDKDTHVTEYNQVYVKAADGGQGHINVTKSTLADSVVQRQSDGNILLPETPAESDDAISKGYADDTYLKIPTNSMPYTSQCVVGISVDGKTTQKWISNPTYIFPASLNVIPMYREVGSAIINESTAPANTIYVAQPQLDYEAANKKYVDSKTNYRLLGTIDLSSGELIYIFDTTGCTEIKILTTEAATYSGGTFNWKAASTAIQAKINRGLTNATYLGDGIISIVSPRGDNDNILTSIVKSGAVDTNNNLVISFASVTSGTIKIYGR